MGRTLTNETTLSVAIESSFGVQPTTGWQTIEPTTIGKFGASLVKLTRTPITKNRQRRKGALTDLNASVEFEADITYTHLLMFAEGLIFAQAQGATVYVCSGVTATGYTVPAGGAIAAGTLVRARGLRNTANNGVKVVTAGSITTEIHAAGLVVETAPTGAIVEICGIQGTAGDFQIDASGNFKSTTFDFTAGVGAMIQVGQFVNIGDVTAGPNSFFTSSDKGLARVSAKAAHVLTLDKKSAVFTVDDGTSTGSGGTALSIWLLFGRYIANVAVDNGNYLERTYQFELAYPNLSITPGVAEYEYAQGSFCNEITFDFQTASKAVMKCAFVSIDCPVPTTTRATGASTAIPPTATTMFNTSADFVRLRVTKHDETGITTDFKNVSLVVKNNVTAEKVLGKLGGKYINAGELDIEMDATCLFTNDQVLTSMRNNDTVTMEVGVRNSDGGFVFDIPSMTIEGGDKQFTVNQTVNITMKAMAFQDDVYGTSLSLSTFPYLPLT